MRRDVTHDGIGITWQLADETNWRLMDRFETDRSLPVVHRLLSTRTVLERICVSKPSLYRMINRGDFPKPVPIGRQRVAFIETEVESWIGARMEARDSCEGAEARRNRAARAVAARRD